MSRKLPRFGRHCLWQLRQTQLLSWQLKWCQSGRSHDRQRAQHRHLGSSYHSKELEQRHSQREGSAATKKIGDTRPSNAEPQLVTMATSSRSLKRSRNMMLLMMVGSKRRLRDRNMTPTGVATKRNRKMRFKSTGTSSKMTNSVETNNNLQLSMKARRTCQLGSGGDDHCDGDKADDDVALLSHLSLRLCGCFSHSSYDTWSL